MTEEASDNINLSHLYVNQMKSIPDIAIILGWPRSRVRDRLISSGITLRSRSQGIKAAHQKLGKHLLGKKRTFTTEWRTNISKSRIKFSEINSLGVSRKTKGYVQFTIGKNKGRGVHVVIMEERIGRKIFPDEVVHHIDGNKQNNDINNLALMTRAAHTRLHKREEQIMRNTNGIS